MTKGGMTGGMIRWDDQFYIGVYGKLHGTYICIEYK